MVTYTVHWAPENIRVGEASGLEQAKALAAADAQLIRGLDRASEAMEWEDGEEGGLRGFLPHKRGGGFYLIAPREG